METKQVIIIRKDLNMRKGKMAAQAAHASMKVLLDLMTEYKDYKYRGKKQEIYDKGLKLSLTNKPEIEDWLNGSFTKVCVSVNSEEELIDIYQQALNKKLPCSIITDAGLTEFNGVPTLTAVAIGPHISEEINKITGHLKLL